jgi:hypothetical protein
MIKGEFVPYKAKEGDQSNDTQPQKCSPALHPIKLITSFVLDITPDEF